MAFHKALAFWVFDRLLGAPSRDWRNEFLNRAHTIQCDARGEEERLRNSRHANAPASLPLKEYAGTYEDKNGNSGPLRVQVDDHGLRLSFGGEGGFSASLEQWHHDYFRLRLTAAIDEVLGSLGFRFVGFTLDRAGRVAAMTAFGATFIRGQCVA
jgi:hypothetical protein